MKSLNDLIDGAMETDTKARAWVRENAKPFDTIAPYTAYEAGARAVGTPLAEALREAVRELESINEDTDDPLVQRTLEKIRAILEGKAK